MINLTIVKHALCTKLFSQSGIPCGTNGHVLSEQSVVVYGCGLYQLIVSTRFTWQCPFIIALLF